MEDNWFLYLFLILIIYWLYKYIDYRKHHEIVSEERKKIINQPVPKYIQQSIKAYKAGIFTGEDRSPLAYVGYKAGKTVNMPNRERQERLAVCFRLEITASLPAKYKNWGKPATYLRFHKMQAHLNMLAHQRKRRRGYEVAVRHWHGDRNWFLKEKGYIANRLRRYGFRY